MHGPECPSRLVHVIPCVTTCRSFSAACLMLPLGSQRVSQQLVSKRSQLPFSLENSNLMATIPSIGVEQLLLCAMFERKKERSYDTGKSQNLAV